MISNELIQKAILTKLKADATLVGYLGSSNNIKESQWQGSTFSYPANRIGEFFQVPLLNGTRTKLSQITFRVETYSEKASSQECQKINGRVVDVLFDSFIYGLNDTGVHTFNLIKIDCVSSGNLVRVTENLWYCASNYRSELHPL
jgi:hypothetical protein